MLIVFLYGYSLTYSFPYGYKKLNLTIFRVIPDPIPGRIDKPSFQRIFIGDSIRVV